MPRAQGCAGAAIARLAALVPKPRVNLTRFHGVFAPNSNHRVTITPAKRVFGIDISECAKCKGPVKIVACIEDTLIIEKIRSHLKDKEANQTSPITQLPQPRAPPLLTMWEQGLAD